MDAEYKRLLEARLSNRDGSSYFDVVSVILIFIPAAFISTNAHGHAVALGLPWLLRVLLETVAAAGPILWNMHAPSALAAARNTLLTAVAAAVFLTLSPSDALSPGPTTGSAGKRSAKAPFFSRCRAALLLLTVTAILAVDFPTFPERFMKTELYGISLMDTGVGCFVYSAGCAIGGKLASVERSTHGGGVSFSRKWLGSAVPLVVLGGVRLLMCWGVDYQEHITEYGKHWNFFFTLAMLPVLFVVLELSLAAVGRPFGWKAESLLLRFPGLVAAFFIVLHQVVLSAFGATEFIASPNRAGLLAANKEGIFSSLGYMGLYFGAIQLGMLLLDPASPAAVRGRNGLMFAAAFGLLTAVADAFIQPCSRRLCNSTYVLFMMAMNTLMPSVFQLVEAHFSGAKPPAQRKGEREVVRTETLLDAVNRNQLVLFLAANLLTGLINVSVRTLYATPRMSYAILSSYLTVLCVTAAALARFGVTLKAW